MKKPQTMKIILAVLTVCCTTACGTKEETADALETDSSTIQLSTDDSLKQAADTQVVKFVPPVIVKDTPKNISDSKESGKAKFIPPTIVKDDSIVQ